MTEAIQDNSIDEGYELASISSRFWAAIVDAIIYGIIVFAVLRYYPYEEHTKNALYIENMTSASGIYHLIIYIAIYFFINYACLRNGQTIGMRLLNIQVADVHGKVASIWRMFFVREVIFCNTLYFFILKYSIAYFLYSFYKFDNSSMRFLDLIVFVDYLFIYRKDRRCLHDLFAGTIVIKLSKKSQDNNNLPKMEG